MVLRLALLATFLSVWAPTAGAQSASGCDGLTAGFEPMSRSLPKGSAENYFGSAPALEEDEVVCLRRLLEQLPMCTVVENEANASGCPGRRILDLVFGGLYRENLPDLIVYLKKDGKTLDVHGRPALMWDGRNTPYLRGAQHLWVAVFSDERLPLEARSTNLYQPPSNPFAGLLSFAGVTLADTAKEAETETHPLYWSELGSSEGRPLYMGGARVDLGHNSQSRLSLGLRQASDKVTVTTKPGGKGQAPTVTTEIKGELSGPPPLQYEGELGFRSINATFSNTAASWFSFGLGFGAALGVDDTSIGPESTEFEAYGLAKVYFYRPQIKLHQGTKKRMRTSWSLFAGTNLTGEFLDQIVFGVSAGHLLGKVGLFAGMSRIPGGPDPRAASTGMDSMDMMGSTDPMNGDMPAAEMRLEEEWRVVVGFDYSF